MIFCADYVQPIVLVPPVSLVVILRILEQRVKENITDENCTFYYKYTHPAGP